MNRYDQLVEEQLKVEDIPWQVVASWDLVLNNQIEPDLLVLAILDGKPLNMLRFKFIRESDRGVAKRVAYHAYSHCLYYLHTRAVEEVSYLLEYLLVSVLFIFRRENIKLVKLLKLG